MEDQELEDLIGLLQPLLRALESLEFIQRYFHPQDLAGVLAAVGEPEAGLAEAQARLLAWPEHLRGLKGRLDAASEAALRAYDGLRTAAGDPAAGPGGAYRALGQLPRAMEALYPLAGDLPPVNRYFLNGTGRQNPDLQLALAEAPASDETGLFNAGPEGAERGGFAVYVPETYRPDRPAPLVVALHGGAGNGRGFLWSWLRDARTAGAILIAPTSTGPTWALAGQDTDSPFLQAILDMAQARWALDPDRLLLTGMSDGGSFTLLSGLEPASPFTHLAPVSTGFHPMMARMADPGRLRGLPIFLTHGAKDWMFDIGMAQQSAQALTDAGGDVTWLQIDDLSHTYPREVNAQILAWLDAPRGGAAAPV